MNPISSAIIADWLVYILSGLWVGALLWTLFTRFAGETRAFTPTLRRAYLYKSSAFIILLLLVSAVFRSAAILQYEAFIEILPVMAYFGLIVLFAEAALAWAFSGVVRRLKFITKFAERRRDARLHELEELPEVEEEYRQLLKKRLMLGLGFSAMILVNMSGYFYRVLLDNPNFARYTLSELIFETPTGLNALKVSIMMAIGIGASGYFIEGAIHGFIRVQDMARWAKDRILLARQFDATYQELRPQIIKNPAINTFTFDLVDPIDPTLCWPPLQKVSVNQLISRMMELCEEDFKYLESLELSPSEAEGKYRELLPPPGKLRSSQFSEIRLAKMLGWEHLMQPRGTYRPKKPQGAAPRVVQMEGREDGAGNGFSNSSSAESLRRRPPASS